MHQTTLFLIHSRIVLEVLMVSLSSR
jgi:hypothetical protein